MEVTAHNLSAPSIAYILGDGVRSRMFSTFYVAQDFVNGAQNNDGLDLSFGVDGCHVEAYTRKQSNGERQAIIRLFVGNHDEPAVAIVHSKLSTMFNLDMENEYARGVFDRIKAA